MEAPLGIRLNNPTLIRFSAAPWVGKKGRDDNKCPRGPDRILPAFEHFDAVEFGVRAAVVLFRHDYRRRGLFDIDSIMNNHFPESDQQELEDEYITPLSQRLGVQARDRINLLDDEVMFNFMGHLLTLIWGRRPSGQAWVPADTLKRGVWLASQPNPLTAAKGN